MDSMRSLNKSLPKAKAPPQPDLHQAFRTAALSVTDLYRSAVADQAKARLDGYNTALEDLLAYLDRHNIGLAEGEGRRIRQWLLERQETHPSDSDEEIAEERPARSSSPTEQTPTQASQPPEPQPEVIVQPEPAPALGQAEAAPEIEMDPPARPEVFHFSAGHPYPSDTNDTAGPDPSTPTRRNYAAARRPNARSHRNLQRSAAATLFSLGSGAGQKRKLMQEYFNIDGFNDRRDGPGGGKRGRMS